LARTLIAKPRDWLSNMLSDLSITTSTSLQQVAEQLCSWTNAEMKHCSKNWPILNDQVLN
jgi:hypothetical protein